MTRKAVDRVSGRKAALRAGIAIAVFLGILGAVYLAQPDNFFLWIKAFHIVAVISWMAGLFYLPRLFIYHTDALPGSELSETFKVMERRLFNVIMRPAMVITWLLGLYLAWSMYGFMGGWLHAKILLVAIMSGFHEHLGRAIRDFESDGPRKSVRYWRLANEVPTVLMILIVILVVLKPF
jgi:protoporphyrinogen IX oxidase